MELFFLYAVICAGVGYAIDEGRGTILGLVFGVFGLIISAILKGK